VDQVKSVWNTGVGTEIYLSEQASGFASFSTDYTFVRDGISRFVQNTGEANNNTWNANFYHVGGGIVLKLRGADITLGATHTGAQETIPRAVSFPDGSGQGIFSTTETANLKWERWRMVFSFSFPFLKDYTKKFTEEKK